MTNKPRFFYASDYAGLEFRGGDFYYGYECTRDKDWCFVTTISGDEIVIPFSKLGCKNMFDVVDCLMTGVGWVLAKYELVLSGKSEEEKITNNA